VPRWSISPFYAIFFVIAGAELNLQLIPAMGALGFVYLFGRTFGKLVGARTASRRMALPETVQRYLGFALLAQAGLAIGLTFAIRERFPEYGAIVSTVVLASVAIYEVIGPISARQALLRAGESGRARPVPADSLLI
jgi:Kef-type K+ transport system membrane component KefB